MEKNNAVIKQVEITFSAPIEFYGRVIDQNGDLVPDAEIGYTAADKFMASGSNYTGKSDAQGFFEISGIKGAGLGVAVRKAGYYFIEEKDDRSPSSAATFGYGMGPDSYRQAPPTRDKPAIFVLQKMGETKPLIYVGTRYYKVTKDGQATEVNLQTGSQVGLGGGDIRFERWATDQNKNDKGYFDWRLRITVPEGGIIEREGEFVFEAPEEGYQKVIEINMPTSSGEKWQYTVIKSYFVKLQDGRYARINATIQAGHNNTPLVLDAFVNPTLGDRNLEFDPAKVVKSP